MTIGNSFTFLSKKQNSPLQYVEFALELSGMFLAEFIFQLRGGLTYDGFKR